MEEKLTWKQLILLEPRLEKLLAEINALPPVVRTRAECNLIRWYGQTGNPGYKYQMSGLVGWAVKVKKTPLSTNRAYDIAYEKLFYALPGCAKCQIHDSCGY